MTIDRDNEAGRNARIEEMLRRLERVHRRGERMATQGQQHEEAWA